MFLSLEAGRLPETNINLAMPVANRPVARHYPALASQWAHGALHTMPPPPS